jgi:hypothetical protein
MLSMVLAGSLALAAVVPGGKVVPQEGDPAPLFEGKWMSYEDTSLAELEGKLVFIEFWRTW